MHTVEKRLNFLSTIIGFICLFPPSKPKVAVFFLFYLQKVNFFLYYRVLSDLHPMTDADLCYMTE